LQKLGYTTIDRLKEIEKPGKLANDLNGYKKKNKLDIGTVSVEQVKIWVSDIVQDKSPIKLIISNLKS
jgi:hypothetical protein